MTTGKISFQGALGANSDMACREAYPDLEPLPCYDFEETIEAVYGGRADLAMIPIENSVAGRVADIHHLLPDSRLHIVGEHFLRVVFHLWGVPGTRAEEVERVHSHVHALGQCRGLIRELGVEPVVHADTAGAAQMVAERGDRREAALATPLAGQIYGLEPLRRNVEDAEHNTTRFLVMAPEPAPPPANDGPAITTFLFEVRSVPAALYKALGGFATNGINMTKLESYMVGGRFAQAQFYADVEAHLEDQALKFAFEELEFFTKEFRVLGCYPAHPFRRDPSQIGGE